MESLNQLEQVRDNERLQAIIENYDDDDYECAKDWHLYQLSECNWEWLFEDRENRLYGKKALCFYFKDCKDCPLSAGSQQGCLSVSFMQVASQVCTLDAFKEGMADYLKWVKKRLAADTLDKKEESFFVVVRRHLEEHKVDLKTIAPSIQAALENGHWNDLEMPQRAKKYKIVGVKELRSKDIDINYID